MSLVIRIVITTATIGVSLAACGNDAAAPTELSFAEWQEQTTAICTEYEPRVDAQAAQLPPVASAQDLVDLIDAITPLNKEYREALLDVGLPTERTAEIESLHADLKTQEELGAEIRAAAVDGGLEAAAPLLDRLTSSGDALNQRAQDLGVPACDSR